MTVLGIIVGGMIVAMLAGKLAKRIHFGWYIILAVLTALQVAAVVYEMLNKEMPKF
ncbi:MAG TPA: hypothetical protein VNN76_08690 [Bacteroidota bacterium]|nr:hypothetical protein [Bacteroidota bacterium]